MAADQGGSLGLGLHPGRPGLRALRVYYDASALAKRYLDEEGAEEVRSLAAASEEGATSRVAFVEVTRALVAIGGPVVGARFAEDWEALRIVEVDDRLCRIAVRLTGERRLRSLDAIHLASALALPREDLVVAVWDRDLHAAARAEGLRVAPETLA